MPGDVASEMVGLKFASVLTRAFFDFRPIIADVDTHTQAAGL